jgi:hypothetical protein
MLKLLSLLAVSMFVLATAPVQAAPAAGLHSLNNSHSIAVQARWRHHRCWWRHGHRHCRWWW